MLTRLPALLFYPLLLLWCLSYGVLGGMVFKLAAVYEHWQTVNRHNYILWKKYPLRSYRKYISTIWAAQIRGLPLEMAEYTRRKIEQNHPDEPFPYLRILANSALMILILPYMLVEGIIKGPCYLYAREMKARRQLFAPAGKPL